MKIRVDLDSTEQGGAHVFLGVFLYDDEGDLIPIEHVEVRDYGRGSTEDGEGNLYEPVNLG